MLSLSFQAIHSCSAPERIQHYRIGQKKRTLGAVLDELLHEEVGENVLARSDDSLTMANERSTAEEISSSIMRLGCYRVDFLSKKYFLLTVLMGVLGLK